MATLIARDLTCATHSIVTTVRNYVVHPLTIKVGALVAQFNEPIMCSCVEDASGLSVRFKKCSTHCFHQPRCGVQRR